jgi:hypothetical protein
LDPTLNDFTAAVLTFSDDGPATARTTGRTHIALFAPTATITIPPINIHTDAPWANRDAGLRCRRHRGEHC